MEAYLVASGMVQTSYGLSYDGDFVGDDGCPVVLIEPAVTMGRL